MTGNTRIGALAAGAAALLAALAIAGCGGESTATGPPASDGQSATVGVANAGDLGKILVDSYGRTLYLFQRDAGTKSACEGACAAAWPPLRVTGTPVAGAGLAMAKIGTTLRRDGKPEVTYNGHPLYRYGGDARPGDTNGQGITAFGGGWFALSAAGTIVSGRTSDTGGSNGY